MASAFNPAHIQRPDPLLMRYYFFCALMTLPAFPFVLLGYWCRYITLRYRFDEDGVSMSYGVFFRREINLTFRRIQDIHLNRNLLQRWMGLATINLQTASGNAQAEMTIEGVLEFERLRDYLYARMRGARNQSTDGIVTSQIITSEIVSAPSSAPALAQGSISATAEPRTLQTLVEIRDALHELVERSGAKA